MIDRLLEPTRIYVKPVLATHRRHPLKGLAHITGGGLTENIPRILPEHLGVVLDQSAWRRSPVFDWLEDAGVPADEMHRSFNCGIGMIAIVAADEADAVVSCFEQQGEDARVIGSVVSTPERRVEIR